MRLWRDRRAHESQPGPDPARVQGPALQRSRARQRFGGFDAQATASGALAGLGCFAFLAALVLAALAGQPLAELSEGLGEVERIPLVLGLVLALTIAARSAGWVAGRLARYDGVRNGLGAGCALLALLALTALLVGAPESASGLDVTAGFEGQSPFAALLVPLLALTLVIVTAGFGGGAGARWHREVDELLLTPAPTSESTALALVSDAEREDVSTPVPTEVAVARERLAARVPIPLPPPPAHVEPEELLPVTAAHDAPVEPYPADASARRETLLRGHIPTHGSGS